MSEQPSQPATSADAGNGGTSGPPSWYTTPPPWWNQAPAQPAGQQPNRSGDPGPSRTDLMSAVNGMPDRIVDAIREAFSSQQPTPDAPANGGNQQNAPAQNSEPAKNDGQEPGKKGSFAEWWFSS